MGRIQGNTQYQGVQWTRYRFSRRERSGDGICASGRLFGLRRKGAMGGIGPRGRPLYVMWALGWGGRALRAAKYANYAGRFAAVLKMSDNWLPSLLIFATNLVFWGGGR